MNKIKKFIEKNKIKNIWINIFSYKNTLRLLNILIDNDIRIDWFDWFDISNNSYQINQNYSRDYSNFSKEDSYKLILEYFLKTEYNDKFYSLSIDSKIYDIK